MILFKRHLLISSLVVSLAGYSVAAPARNGQTLGDLFSNAEKGNTDLPNSSYGFKAPEQKYDLESVKPPKSSQMWIQEGSSSKAQDDKILNQQINELYKLTQRFKNSPNRGELWLRLAELYVEKSTLIDSRKQDEYDAKLRAFQTGKSKVKPKLDTADARDYNKKAIQLYEWFLRDFPKDEKVPQAFFFLGFNYFELGDMNKGAGFYERLTKTYPESQYVAEARFALAEYYFENEKWAQAYKEYAPLIKERNHRLNSFATYKGAWCLFRIGKYSQAMSYLEYIIKSAKKESAAGLTGKKIDYGRLEAEATRDIVVFYSEGGDPANAAAYFRNLLGGNYLPQLERLAYQYSDRGNKDASRDVFKVLIAQNPTSPKAFEYQYQIVQNYYYAKNVNGFKGELQTWVRDYDVGSPWHNANKGNKVLIDNSHKLRETTLRNYVLQMHQTAQNSRAAFSQGQANEAYQLYLKAFPGSPMASDMHFYYGELLYDMNKFDDAAVQYKWVVDNAPQSKFYDKAAQNLILAVEKSIPTDQEMQKRVGNSLEAIPLEPRIERFIKVGLWYIEKFPQSQKTPEIKFRIGRLYYQNNHFDPAIKSFKEIVQKHPNTKYGEYSANLLLDIYNIRKDYVGLEKVGAELLTVSAIASSKTGSDIRGILERASFKKAQDLEGEKKYGDSAQVFESFAKQNPKSELAITAIFNAGVNYERAGKNSAAILAYQEVLRSKDPAAEKLKPKSKRLLAKQYQDSAQFEEAARLYREAALESSQDPLSVNLMFNAAVLYEALGREAEAIRSYNDFTKMNKKKSENVEVLYNIATIQRNSGQKSTAIAKYIEYVELGGRSQERVVESAYWVAVLSREQRAMTRSKEWAAKTFSIQRRFAPNKKGVGASYAAKLKLVEANEVFNEFKAITFPRDPSKQKQAADRKLALLAKLNGELSEVIKYDSAEEIVSSLSILGQANLNMVQSILNAPLPAGLNAEEVKQYKAGVEKFAEPFSGKARESFKLAVDRGHELEVYNPAYRDAYSYMSQLDSKTYYSGTEYGSDLRLINWMGR